MYLGFAKKVKEPSNPSSILESFDTDIELSEVGLSVMDSGESSEEDKTNSATLSIEAKQAQG